MKKLIVIFALISGSLFSGNLSQVDSLLTKSHKLYNSNLDSVFIVLKQAYDLTVKMEDNKKEVAVAIDIISYASYSSKFDLGKEYFDKVYETAKKDGKLQAELLIKFSNLQKENGMFDWAIQNLMKAQHIADSLSLTVQKYHVFELLSNIFMLKQDYDKSLDYAKSALVSSKKLMDNDKIGWSYVRMANTLLEMENFSEAEFNYQNAIKYFTITNDKNAKAQVYNNLGLVYQKEKRFNEAEQFFLEAYKISKEIKYFVFQVYIEAELGDFYRTIKDYKKAKFFFDLALKGEKEANYAILSQSLFMNLHDYYKETGDFIKSLEYFEKYSLLTDSLNKINQDQLILETETKFRTKEKQKEIEFLFKENDLQQSQLQKRNIILILSFAVILIAIGLVFVIQKSRKKQINTNKVLAQKNIEIEHQKKEIVDSINYAKRIQDASLGNPDRIKQEYKNSSILFQPKDILSGDFYWFNKKGDDFMFSVADCTGHGVPGAMMSMIGNNGLNDALKSGMNKPGEILNHLSSFVSQNFNKKDFDVKDGMDIAFCSLNTVTGKLTYSGALNSVFISKLNGEFLELKTHKSYIGQPDSVYSDSEIQLEKGDTVYIMSDGYVDQFGGENDKKFKISGFKEIAKIVSKDDIDTKMSTFTLAINKWKKKVEQTDDICLIAVTF